MKEVDLPVPLKIVEDSERGGFFSVQGPGNKRVNIPYTRKDMVADLIEATRRDLPLTIEDLTMRRIGIVDDYRVGITQSHLELLRDKFIQFGVGINLTDGQLRLILATENTQVEQQKPIPTEAPKVGQKIYGLTGEIGKDGILTPEEEKIRNEVQERAARACLDYLDNIEPGDPFPAVAFATGVGKTHIARRIITEIKRINPNARILIIPGTKLELVKQMHRSISEQQELIFRDLNKDKIQFNGVEDYIDSEDLDGEIEADEIDEKEAEDLKDSFTIGKYGDRNAEIQIATIQTLQSAHKKGLLDTNFDLVIVDEVHNIGTPQRKAVIDSFKSAVGFSATPFRHSGNMKTPEDYGFKVVDSLPLPEAQNLGILPPLREIQIQTKHLAENVPMTPSGNIDYRSLEKILKNSPELRPYIADRVAQLIGEDNRYKTVIAVNFVWEAQELAELLHDRGIKVGVAVNKAAAKLIHTVEIPSIDSIDRYKFPQEDPNSVQVLISPYVAGEGFDAPATEVLVWASPTDSSLRYTQYTGRLARQCNGKAFGLVVDCLYQTSQYNWSYNFGMWMKGDVRELPDGTLYLGPDDKIVSSGFGSKLSSQSDKVSIEYLQNNGVDKLKEGEIVISEPGLKKFFRGDGKKLVAIAMEIVEQLRRDSPTSISIRDVGGNKTKPVVINTKIFTELMTERGIKVKRQKLTASDFVINGRNLGAIFIGDWNHVRGVAKNVVQQIREKSPYLVEVRQTGPHEVYIVKDKNLFISLMVNMGVTPRDPKLRLDPKDQFILTHTELSKIFFGSSDRLYKVAEEVKDYLLSEDMKSIIFKRSSRGKGIVFRSRERFIQEMLARGIKLKPQKEE